MSVPKLPNMASNWSDTAARYLGDRAVCPRCGAQLTEPGRCVECRADLGGSLAREVWQASAAVIDAIERRQRLVDALPQFAPKSASESLAVARTGGAANSVVALPGAETKIFAAPSAVPTAQHSGQAQQAQTSLQSVLALAGSALLAVAAVVFTFLNPDLTNFATRTLIIAAVTAVFLGGAWLLARLGLTVSAETVGSLGLVFVALDAWAMLSASPLDPAWSAAIGTLAASVALLGAAVLARLRSWLWVSLLGLMVTPSQFGYALGGSSAAVVGHVAAGGVALVVLAGMRRLGSRFGSPLRLDRGTAAGVLITVAVSVPLQLWAVGSSALEASAALFALSVLAALAARFAAPQSWSFVAGWFAASAGAVLAISADAALSFWVLALAPAAGCAALLLLIAVPDRLLPRGVLPGSLAHGAGAVVLLCVAPTLFITCAQLVLPQSLSIPAAAGTAAILGLIAVASTGAALALPGMSHASIPRRRAGSIALWLLAAGLLDVAGWTAVTPEARVTFSLAAASTLAVLLRRLRTMAAASASLRLPVVVAAHALVLVGAVTSWATPTLSVVGGVAVVASVLLVCRAVVRRASPGYVAVAYAYALIVVTSALTTAGIDLIVVLCLVSTLASVIALAATALTRLPARIWYVLLGVTAVPFVIGIVMVVAVRSGWTALSTGMMFALALTIVLTRRPGLNPAVRNIAAALLVPALAVVVTCLGAQFLETSGSPVVLPVVAVMVAVVLPCIDDLGALLVRRGVGMRGAVSAATALEATTLLTAALAVLLSLVRAAAGLDTTLVVLLLVSTGAAAAARFAGRRYARVVAAIGYTGALWCVWALIGVAALEPYTLPPALALAAVGLVGAARGTRSPALLAWGLGAAVLPSLVLVATDIDAAAAWWRTAALLACAAGLAVAAVWLGRTKRSVPRLLAGPAAGIAVLAAASGVVQSLRLGLDPTSGVHVIVPVLVVSLVSAAVAVVADMALSSRWRLVPAAVYLVAGPITASRVDWLTIAILWLLMAVLLGGMLVAAVRARTAETLLPPVPVLFVLAWCTAVAGWSARELRVEAFSLPLGLTLVVCGVIAMRSEPRIGAAQTDWALWPHGFRGSWRLLGPGLFVTLFPSVLSTGTDPLTSRAVLVIALALVAILVGSRAKLAAPFITGLVVLPVENVVVFAVQIGRSIGAAPWWITLATAGAVLLVLAVSSERRVATHSGVAARMRDLG